MYVIIFCGYEGIGNLLWAGGDKTTAAEKLKEARHKVGKLSKIRKKYYDFDDEEYWEIDSERFYSILEKWPAPWRHVSIMGNEHDIERVCIMELQGEWGFRCVCKDFGIINKTTWYY